MWDKQDPIIYTACSEGDQLPVFEVLCEALQGRGSIEERVEELSPVIQCSKQHKKYVEIGCGHYFCAICGEKWHQ